VQGRSARAADCTPTAGPDIVATPLPEAPSAMTDSTLDVALRAVADACAVSRTVQGDLARIRALVKSDSSPVTVADFAAQAIVSLHLGAALDGFALVGEESAAVLRADEGAALADAVADAVRGVIPGISTAAVLDAIDRGDHDARGARYWTLDPIDGTKGFLRGGQYAVSLALIERGEVTLGVLGCPNLGANFDQPFDTPAREGSLFYARRGDGAWTLPASRPAGRGAAIAVARGRALTELRVCESVEAGHSRQDETALIVRHLAARGAPARLDSQTKYAVVARGQADAYLRLPVRADYVEKIWDHAAGKLVAEEAGAVVTDIDGRPLDFSRGATLSGNRGIVCAPPEFHAPLLAAIKTLGY
jgi:3'(2'), 5'-bisphosphate nucleotidase